MILTVNNIGGCKHARLELDRGKVTVLRGPNASGKTSILRALQVLVTREHNPLGLTATELKDMASHSDITESEAVLSGRGWTLTWTPGSMVAEQGHPPSDLMDAIVVDPKLVDKKGVAAKTEWQKILPCAVERDKLFDRLVDDLTGARKCGPAVTDLCDQVFKQVADDVWEERKKGWVYARETAADRLRTEKALWCKAVATTGTHTYWSKKEAAKWFPLGWNGDCDGVTIPEAEQAVSDARKAYTEAYAANAVTEAQVEERRRLQRGLVELRGRLSEAQQLSAQRLERMEPVKFECERRYNEAVEDYDRKRLDAHHATGLHVEARKQANYREGLKESIKELRTTLVQAEKDVETAKSEVRAVTKQVDEAYFHEIESAARPTCPQCGVHLLIDKESIPHPYRIIVDRKSEDQKDQNRKQHDRLNELKSHCKDVIASFNTYKNQFQRAKGMLSQHIAEHGKTIAIPKLPKSPVRPVAGDFMAPAQPLMKAYEEAKRNERTLDVRVSQVRHQLSTLPEGDAGDPNAIREAEDLLDQAKKNRKLVTAYRTAKGHFESAERWQRAVNTLGTSGIRLDEARSVTNKFNKFISDRQPALPKEWALPSVFVDPKKFQVLINGRTFRHASGTEQLLAKAFLSCGIAKWTGAKVVLFDELETLVGKEEGGDQRREFLGYLKAVAREMNWCVVAAEAVPTVCQQAWTSL